MTFSDVLDAAESIWSDEIGIDAVAKRLRDAALPPDEGAEAQARLDAMLAT